MKMRKVISTVLAGVLALSALPISAMSAGAEGAYAPGDVDMDGFVTAHDAAVVSRALYVDNNLLTSEQKKLADVNGDGKITQEDADWIHETRCTTWDSWTNRQITWILPESSTSSTMWQERAPAFLLK
ncbi:MAG: dockerin type I repeat-containing protein [Ruminococcus callidus]